MMPHPEQLCMKKFQMKIFRDPLMGRRRRWGLMLPALLLTVLSVRLTCADPDPKPKPREWRQWSARGSFTTEVAFSAIYMFFYYN